MRPQRTLGSSDLSVTPVSLGCWPMAGVTTLDATHEDGVATVLAAIESGITHLDTAYVYGPNGESDQIIAEALSTVDSNDLVIASKVGIHYEGDAMRSDGRPGTILAECDTLLDRLGLEQIDLLYLHSPDPEVPVAESAGAISQLISQGKVRLAGLSNASLDQVKDFNQACPLAAVQLPYNMLQRGIEQETLPWCIENQVSVFVYWGLMKGLLSGRMPRDHKLQEGDSRSKYPMYQGDEWQRNQDFLDQLKEAAALTNVTVAQLVVNWTFNQPGVTSILCGAKRPWQIEETVKAMEFDLTSEQLELIDHAIADRGKAATNRDFR